MLFIVFAQDTKCVTNMDTELTLLPRVVRKRNRETYLSVNVTGMHSHRNRQLMDAALLTRTPLLHLTWLQLREKKLQIKKIMNESVERTI